MFGSMAARRIVLVVVWFGATLLAAPVVHAATPAKKSTKTPASGNAALSAQIAEQKRRIDELRDLIDQQRELLEAQRAVADSQAVAHQARVDSLEKQIGEMKIALEQLNSQAGLPAWEGVEARIKRIEEATKEAPELPPDIVSAGDLPGSIRIPGSDAAIKIGARIRTAAVITLDPLGTEDRFLTSSIPVGVPVLGEAKRTNISARASRLNMEFRTPGGREQVRAFFEGDFSGAGNAFALRHAYAQYTGFIVGQTWSTFSDPGANHLDLDFEGVSSENVIRQPLIRYWWGIEGGTRFAVAVETPSVSVTGGIGVNLFPDVVGRAYYAFAGGGHLQLAGVVRQIRAQSVAGEVSTVWGGGGTASGVILVPVRSLKDRIVFQLNGGVGIARYINDLSKLGGQDAVFDTATARLEALPAIGWYASYEHIWKEWATHMNLRSMVMWSHVGVDNLEFQPPDAYDYTNRFSVNAVISPSKRVDMGVEYIWGERVNKDDQRGSANQIQLVGLFRF